MSVHAGLRGKMPSSTAWRHKSVTSTFEGVKFVHFTFDGWKVSRGSFFLPLRKSVLHLSLLLVSTPFWQMCAYFVQVWVCGKIWSAFCTEFLKWRYFYWMNAGEKSSRSELICINKMALVDVSLFRESAFLDDHSVEDTCAILMLKNNY